jgi:hypothetical protein
MVAFTNGRDLERGRLTLDLADDLFLCELIERRIGALCAPKRSEVRSTFVEEFNGWWRRWRASWGCGGRDPIEFAHILLFFGENGRNGRVFRLRGFHGHLSRIV